MNADFQAVQELAERIKPLLAGRSPEIQSAVLAELLSLWLAGHYLMGPATIERLLELHIDLVRKFLPENIRALKARGLN